MSPSSFPPPGGDGGPSSYFSNLGLGYPIALALAFLVLLSILLLVASYICCRASSTSNSRRPRSAADGIIVPRIVFVAEDDEGDVEAAGLEQAVINSYPKFPYEKEEKKGKEGTCSICLCEYKEAEMVRMMPECRHWFHLCCLDAWLRLNASCPVCRNSPLPTPLSTPLQERLPLSAASSSF